MADITGSVADRLRALVRGELSRGESLLAIAKRADMPYSVLHKFANSAGKTLNIETAEALARALGKRLAII